MIQEERNKHYRHALVAVENGEHFICNILYFQLRGRFSSEELEEFFPEFFKRKPEIITASFDEGGWWPMNDAKSRIEVLKQCIEETNPKKINL
jgi:hypothetical protein